VAKTPPPDMVALRYSIALILTLFVSKVIAAAPVATTPAI